MKIKVAVENLLKNLGLEIHHVSLDSMDEMQQLTILSGLVAMRRDSLEIQVLEKEVIEIQLLNESKKINE